MLVSINLSKQVPMYLYVSNICVYRFYAGIQNRAGIYQIENCKKFCIWCAASVIAIQLLGIGIWGLSLKANLNYTFMICICELYCIIWDTDIIVLISSYKSAYCCQYKDFLLLHLIFINIYRALIKGVVSHWYIVTLACRIIKVMFCTFQ